MHNLTCVNKLQNRQQHCLVIGSQSPLFLLWSNVAVQTNGVISTNDCMDTVVVYFVKQCVSSFGRIARLEIHLEDIYNHHLKHVRLHAGTRSVTCHDCTIKTNSIYGIVRLQAIDWCNWTSYRLNENSKKEHCWHILYAPRGR